MGAVQSFRDAERAHAAAWKQRTGTLTDAAKRPAPYRDKGAGDRRPSYHFCLPAQHAERSLLPEVRQLALDLFAELRIPWHDGIAGAPSNHLLSSQVQCVNALGQMVGEPERLVRAFGPVLGTAEVSEIEPGRHLTFEYIGPTDFFGEAPGGDRIRGAHCTSVDAAFLQKTGEGRTELVLLEWKYTEVYGRRRPDRERDDVRWRRYGAALGAADSPVDSTLLAFSDLLQEPFYQLVRQQLLAHELEKAHAHGADRVRVVHVLPKRNLAYRQSLQPAHKELGACVSDVWQRLLRRPDRFVQLDTSLFRDPTITSDEYVDRYQG